MYACRVGKLNIVKLLVEVFKMNLELLNGSKCSALTYACYFKNIDIVKYLIKKGANMKNKDANGNTWFFYLDDYHKNIIR